MGLQRARVLAGGGAGRCVHGECCPLSFFLRGVVTNVIYYLIYRRQMWQDVSKGTAPISSSSRGFVLPPIRICSLELDRPRREARVKTMLSLSYPEEFVIFRVVSFPTFPIKFPAWFNAVVILW